MICLSTKLATVCPTTVKYIPSGCLRGFQYQTETSWSGAKLLKLSLSQPLGIYSVSTSYLFSMFKSSFVGVPNPKFKVNNETRVLFGLIIDSNRFPNLYVNVICSLKL